MYWARNSASVRMFTPQPDRAFFGAQAPLVPQSPLMVQGTRVAPSTDRAGMSNSLTSLQNVSEYRRLALLSGAIGDT